MHSGLKREINKLDEDRLSPLHYAAKYGKLEAAKILVSSGARIDLRGEDGCFPIHFAVKYRPKFFENELESGHMANDFINTLKFLIEKLKAKEKRRMVLNQSVRYYGANDIELSVDVKDDYGSTPLHYAITRQNIRATKILISNQADIALADKQGQSAIHCAAYTGEVGLVRAFLLTLIFLPLKFFNTKKIQKKVKFSKKKLR